MCVRVCRLQRRRRLEAGSWTKEIDERVVSQKFSCMETVVEATVQKINIWRQQVDMADVVFALCLGLQRVF